MRIQNRLSEVRRRRGLSAADLASKAGVKRQTIYAIEAQKFVPNTLVALRLAQILEVGVEELFSIEPVPAPPDRPRTVDLLTTHGDRGQPDQPVRLCRIGRRIIAVPSPPLVGELPPADALVVGSAKAGRTLVRTIPVEEEAKNRLIAAGCDPAMPVLSRYLSKHADIDLITPGCSSTQALTWLRERKIHIAGTHLRDEARGGSSQAIVERFLPKDSFRIVTFASWEEGLVVAEANPKRIRSVADLVRPDVVLINREVGAGSRFLLDGCLSKEGIPPARVRGYQQTASGHILAAWHVYSGKADCCIATRAAARVFSLGFIPLVNERYDLVIPLRYWGTHAVQAVLDSLNRSSLRAELEAIGGYDTTQTGRLVT